MSLKQITGMFRDVKNRKVFVQQLAQHVTKSFFSAQQKVHCNKTDISKANY